MANHHLPLLVVASPSTISIRNQQCWLLDSARGHRRHDWRVVASCGVQCCHTRRRSLPTQKSRTRRGISTPNRQGRPSATRPKGQSDGMVSGLSLCDSLMIPGIRSSSPPTAATCKNQLPPRHLPHDCTRPTPRHSPDSGRAHRNQPRCTTPRQQSSTAAMIPIPNNYVDRRPQHRRPPPPIKHDQRILRRRFHAHSHRVALASTNEHSQPLPAPPRKQSAASPPAAASSLRHNSPRRSSPHYHHKYAQQEHT